MRNSGAPNHWPCPPGFNGRLAGIYRFSTGRPLNGHRYTDATFLRPGTMATDLSGHASAYQLWPGWKRALATRWPWPLLATLAILVATGHWPVAIWVVAIVATLATPGIVAMAKERGHRREVIEPVATAVAKVLAKRHDGHGHTWVTIPRGHRDIEQGVVATVAIPANWPGDKGEMARVSRTVMAKLGDPDLVATWELAGRSPYVEFCRPAKPPTLVELAVAKLWIAKATELAMGQGPGGKPVIFSLALESPHLLIAGGSGAGKSELLAWLVGQFMTIGYGVACLDAKFVSHLWLRRVPGVLYAAESEELHEALIWLDAEMLRRARFVASGGDPDTLIPLVTLLEEMNAATNRLRAYWGSIKQTGDPMMSPALTALANLSSMGRELRIHVLMAGQSLTAKATGGVENRENFGGRALARATRNQWKMLAPQIKNPPLKRTEPGRWHLVVGDEVREFQAPFCDLKDEGKVAALIAWATSGEPIPDVPAMMMTQDLTRRSTVSDAGSSASAGRHIPGSISLSAYVATRTGLTLTQVQNWRKRHAEAFPEAVGEGDRGAQLYDEAELDRFVWNRVGSA